MYIYIYIYKFQRSLNVRKNLFQSVDFRSRVLLGIKDESDTKMTRSARDNHTADHIWSYRVVTRPRRG